MHVPGIIQDLLNRGAVIPDPCAVYIAPEVDPGRLSANITLHPGCRLTGKTTSIGPGCHLGEEGPVTLSDCQLVGKVTLKGGSFAGTVMMEGVTFGPCAHVREASLLEEFSSCAHSVGLKQTLLLPYVTLGSLINFCDCLMAGGTSRKNHSEVGSSYIHFNYTPHQDKATASLIGDVPRGVFLDQHPIFLGGQGGLVGPRRIEYGTLIAAGTICRKDVLSADKLIAGGGPHRATETRFEPFLYGDISKVLTNNFIYLGNLHALYHWYVHVRQRFVTDAFSRYGHDGALKVLSLMTDERIKRLAGLAENLATSLDSAQQKSGDQSAEAPYDLQRRFVEAWPNLAPTLALEASATLHDDKRSSFLARLGSTPSPAYIKTIATLSPHDKREGTAWLQAIVDSIAAMGCLANTSA